MKTPLTFQRLLLAAGLLALAPRAGWAQTLTFDDEFNSLDLSGKGAWQPNANGVNPNGKTYSNGTNADPSDLSAFFVNPNYAPLAAANPFSVTDGVLDIAIKPTPSSINPADVNNKPYVTGFLQTANKFSQLYGYFEMRAKIPAGNGVGGAFWLLPTDGSWPPEIDIMENLGENTSFVFHTLHSTTYPKDANGNLTQKQAYGNIPGGSYSNSYHTYGVDWEADNITFYIDGKQTGQFPTPDDMRKKMYVVLSDNATGPGRGWGKDIDSTTPIPAHFNIDYLRVYTAKPDLSSGGSPTPGGTPATTGLVSGGVYKLLARHSGMALDVDGGGATDGAKVQQWTAYDNNPNQEWRVDLQTDGTYTLTHNKTNARLDTKWGGTSDGTVVWQYAANDSDAQRWEIKPTDNGYYKLLRKGTNKCLDVDGGNGALATGTKVQLWEFLGGQNYNQQWQFQRLSVSAARAGAPSAGAASANAPAAPGTLSVYPNPAGEQLTVSTSLAQAGAVQLSLHDQVGRLVRTRTQAAEAGAQTLPLDLRGLPAGLYLLRVQQPGRPAQTRKVTVQP